MAGEGFWNAVASGGGGGGALDLLHVRDEKAAASDGGTFTSGAWQTRTLNTVKTNEISGASLAANVVSLPAGTYEVEARAPALKVNRHKCRLRNVTASTTLVVGSTEYTDTNNTIVTASVARGRFTLASTSDVRLEHYGQVTRTTNGFGAANSINDGEVEVYAEVLIRKVS